MKEAFVLMTEGCNQSTNGNERCVSDDWNIIAKHKKDDIERVKFLGK